MILRKSGHRILGLYLASIGLGTGLLAMYRKDVDNYFKVKEKIKRSSLKLRSAFAVNLTRFCAKFSRGDFFHRMKLPHMLVMLSNSEVDFIHNVFVKALSVVHFESNEEIQKLKCNCKPHTLVSLARTPGCHQGWFTARDTPNACIATGNSESLENDIIKVLEHLFNSTSDTCTMWMIEESLKLYNIDHAIPSTTEPKDRQIFWAFGEDTLLDYQPSTIPEEQKWAYYLDSLKHASSNKEDSDTLLHTNILQLLEQTVVHFHDNSKLLALCLDIVANFALTRTSHEDIVSTGFVEVAKQATKYSYGEVASAGFRTLHNLDIYDPSDCSLQDGMHQLYPEWKTDPKDFVVDIVFVHGLSGGPFWTWRQRTENSSDFSSKSSTECWPKDWLASDVQNARIFCVEYNTHLTNWSVSCPYTSETHTLTSRAQELQTKLLQAGIGKRPIIWITHSMGGLIVKDLLVNTSPDKRISNILLDNTKGIVFYSVPHRGSPLARQVSRAKYLIFPSVEVTDLQQDSTRLLELHDKFIDKVKKMNIHILSLLETQPLEIPVLRLKVMIVPSSSAHITVGNSYDINQNHVYVCKPENKDDLSYREVLKMVDKIIRENYHEL